MTRKPERGRTRTRARLVALAGGLGFLLAACAPETITDSGQKVHSLYNVVLVMAAVVFVGVEVAIAYAAIRYRRHKGDATLPEQFHGNTKIEIVWTLIPSIIVLALFVMSMVVLADVNREHDNDPLTVRVTGFQWQWQFEYFKGPEAQPESLGVSIIGTQAEPPTLVLPVGERIHFDLVAQDVVHSFYIPDFLFKRDLIPGRTNHFETTILPKYANQEFHGQCAELCGDLHNEMTFDLQTMTAQGFDVWVKDEAAKEAKSNTCAPTGTDLHIEAQDLAFDTTCLAAPAGQPFTIEFVNHDAAPHNVDIYDKDPAQGGKHLAGGKDANDTIISATTTYQVDPLDAGNYYFQCDVHTGMHGAFVVK